MRIAWLLNLDADLEFAHGEGYRRSPPLLRRIREWSSRVLGLPAEGDTLLPLAGEVPPGLAAAGPSMALCWSPTPSALARLEDLGFDRPKAPAFEVLRKVNAREWVSPLGGGLPGGRLVGSLEEVLEGIREGGGAWRLKTRFGFAGRGQRSCEGEIRLADRHWITARIEEDGGLWLEPEVEVVEAFSLHGWLLPDGGLRVGRLLRQWLGPGGRWEGAEPMRGGPVEEMERTLRLVAEALEGEGYFGPFGLDGVAWKRGPSQGFCPLLECNARLTMAFGLGLCRARFPEIP